MAELKDVQTHLGRLTQGWRQWALATGVSAVVAVFAWVSLGFIGFDFLARFSPWACWGAWVLLLGLLGATLVLTVRRYRRPLGPANVSRRVEARQPELNNRLINVVQFAASADATDQAFAQALLTGAHLDLERITAWQLFPQRWFKAAAATALAGVLLSLILAAAWPRGYAASLVRLCAPMAGRAPYTLTQLQAVAPGNTSVLRGETLDFVVTFGGVIPREAWVLLKTPEAGERSVPLAAAPETAGRFAARSPALFSDATYYVRGGDARSARFTVTVDNPPALVTWAAAVTPPAYTGLAPAKLGPEQTKFEVPAGSQVAFSATATVPLRSFALLQEGKGPDHELAGVTKLETAGPITKAAPVTLKLLSTRGHAALVPLPFVIVPDQPPAVDFTYAERRLKADPGAVVPLEYQATDDYGVREVGLQQVDEGEKKVLGQADNGARRSPQLKGRFFVDLGKLKAKAGSVFRFRLVARDNGPEGAGRTAQSRVLEVFVPALEEARKEQDLTRRQSEQALARLLTLQQENLKLSRGWKKEVEQHKVIPVPTRESLRDAQARIAALGRELLGLDDVLGDLKVPLTGLVNQEMPAAVAELTALCRAPELEQGPPLDRAIALEVQILAALRGLPEALTFENQYQERTDLLTMLEKLVGKQRQNLQQTRTALEKKPAAAPELAAAQDELAAETMAFLEAAGRQTGKEKPDDFAVQVGEMIQLLETEKLYDQMLTAAGQLEKNDWAAAAPTEEVCLKVLLKGLAIMNEWRIKRADQIAEKLGETLKEIGEELGNLERRQKEIVEVSKDLTKRGELDDKIRDELGKMDKEQRDWKQLVEKMAQDLYQFPELPVCNELNGKMREVFEDVEQAADSANAPAAEVAVQKEDSLLDAIKNTKKRVEDVEMWLPDAPDNIKWDMETFDAAEFPVMPLVDLPEELEDIVGDLLEQNQEIDKKSQDSTGNNMMADAEMGWDIMDGPMPNFSAKGKSGNTAPNDNEMTGRSGAGREGQSTGELVENKVKGLEGRETHARKTNDASQKGQVEEEEGSTLEAKATGGGKLGGESETKGMFGDAPRRDLHMKGSAKTPQELRQETEALYAKARMLYLGNTRNLAAAGEGMRLVERVDANMKGFENLQQRVVRRLRDSQTELTTGAVLPMPVTTAADAGGATAVQDVNLEEIDEQYRGVVADYYKSLARE